MKEYIEREAVLERLGKVDMDTYYGFTAAVQFGVNHAIQCIKEAPAADVVEVRHGRWCRTKDGDWECSECKEAVVICDCGKDQTYRKPFCPNCGAKMWEEAADEIQG